MNQALATFVLLAIGFLVILEGVGLAMFPKALAFMAGPGASRPSSRIWNRYQGLGFMFMGLVFVMGAVRPTSGEAVIVALGMAASVMFSLAVIRRGHGRHGVVRPVSRRR